MTVTTAMPVVSAKASAKIAAIVFMIVSPFSRYIQFARTDKEFRDRHHVSEVFGIQREARLGLVSTKKEGRLGRPEVGR
jgi:hypothetical protein